MERDLAGVTVAFDLDGTLIDTAPDLIATAEHLLRARGLRPVGEGVLRPQISFGSRHMMRVALDHLGADASDAVLDDMFPQFLTHYRQNISVHSRPFPGLIGVLETLRQRGAKLAVCTNKLEEPTRALLNDLSMTGHFDAIAGRDTYPVHKPDPGHLTSVIRAAGGDPARAVMVGDSEVDTATAKAAGIPVIGVTFGYTQIPVRQLACDAVIEGYDQFFAAFDPILARA